MTEQFRNRMSTRVATITRNLSGSLAYANRYIVALEKHSKLRHSTRVRTVATKPAALSIAREWVNA